MGSTDPIEASPSDSRTGGKSDSIWLSEQLVAILACSDAELVVADDADELLLRDSLGVDGLGQLAKVSGAAFRRLESRLSKPFPFEGVDEVEGGVVGEGGVV